MHLYLGVFFSPLLLLFIVTGWWQTFVRDDDRDKGDFNAVMSKVSMIHTDDYLPPKSVLTPHHPSEAFKLLVGTMAVALIISILMGLAVACQTKKKALIAGVLFLLGIVVPSVILYFDY